MKKINSKKGFTLVELMLAVAFLGTLLLSIAMLTIQLINIYTKGATMRSINTTASSIMKDLRASIGYSGNYPAVLDTEGSRTDYFWRDNSVAAESKYGMFCTGAYTYVWNYRDAMVDYREGSSNEYMKITLKSESNAYALAKVYDRGCGIFEETKNNGSKEINVGDKAENLTVLLDGRSGSEGSDLALYDFSVITATRSSVNGRALYDISFVLGTMQGQIDITSSNDYCNNSTGGAATKYDDVSMDYCSVNRFEIVVRQSGINID